MKNLIKKLMALIRYPQQTIPVLAGQGVMKEAMIVVSTSAIVSAILAGFTFKDMPMSVAVVSMIVMVILPFVVWGAAACIAYFFAGLFGGKGSMRQLLIVMGYINVFDIIGLVLGGAAMVVGLPDFLPMACRVWVLCLYVLAVKEVLHLPLKKAVAAIWVPVFLLIGVFVFLFVAIMKAQFLGA
jgi:hypothetical protein